MGSSIASTLVDWHCFLRKQVPQGVNGEDGVLIANHDTSILTQISIVRVVPEKKENQYVGASKWGSIMSLMQNGGVGNNGFKKKHRNITLGNNDSTAWVGGGGGGVGGVGKVTCRVASCAHYETNPSRVAIFLPCDGSCSSRPL